MKKKILFVLSLLFGLMFINAGLNKFFNYMPVTDLPEKMQQLMNAFNEIGWLLPLVGVAEILGGILIIFPKTRAIATLILFPIMVGIVLINTLQDTTGLPIVLVLTAIFIWIILDNKEKYTHLIK